MECLEIENLSKALYAAVKSDCYDDAISNFFLAAAHLNDISHYLFGDTCRVELISDTNDGVFKDEV